MSSAHLFLSDTAFAWRAKNAAPVWTAWQTVEQDLPNVAALRNRRLTQLNLFLQEQTVRRLQIGLGGAWCHLQIVQYPKGLRAGAERQMYLRNRLVDVYGAIAGHWQMVHESTYMNQPFMLAALEQEILTSLQSSAKNATMRLTAMQPAFMQCFNQVRSKLKAVDGAFALLEEGRLSVGIWKSGVWQSIRSQPCAHVGADGLQTLLIQMAAQCAPLQAPYVYIVSHAAHPLKMDVPQLGAWRVVNLQE